MKTNTDLFQRTFTPLRGAGGLLRSLLSPLLGVGGLILLGAGGLFAQSPISISYSPPSVIDASGLNTAQLAAAPKECVIDFHYSAPSVRVVMESPDGTTNYVDRVFPLEVQAFADSTYVYGKPGAWTINLGQFEGVTEFRVRLLNPNGPGLGAAIGQGTYP